MKYFLSFLFALILFGSNTFGQTGGVRAVLGPDSIPIFTMYGVVITAKAPNNRQKKKLEKEVKKFNKLRYDILKVWPYAQEAAKNVKIIEAELVNIPDPEAQKLYLKSRESFLFGKYEKDLKNLTIGQGKILVKLIDRQTAHSAYSLIYDIKSPASAFFWQTIGGVFGYNLKEKYDPDDELAIEVIVTSIEAGDNPTYYDYLAEFRRQKANNN